ncbi:MAG: efflux RND transporter periplasmic adaptor subunit [Bacteroidetes bacterium]|nr:efflux RND transporter periplasmic adaptor subunit [Bacteroidota bacterium]
MKKIFIFLSVSVSLIFASCGSDIDTEEKETLVFEVTNPLKKDTTIVRDYVCQIHAINHIDLRALERGYLQKTFVDEGQFVKEGQLMFRIMPMLYEAEKQKAQAEVNFAEIEYRTTKSLSDGDVVSKNELAMAKAKMDKANAELQLAKVHLGFTEIRAPFSGIMGRFQARLGSLVEEGDLLTSLSDNSKMWVYYNVPEAEYLDYKTAINKDSLHRVRLLMANNELFNFEGIVETIEADFNNETGNIAFRATFPNPKKILRHGETGNIRMRSKIKDALIIPQKATFEVLEKRFVFVVNKQGVVHAKEVKIASELQDLYVLKGGISETDRIIVEGIRKVKENQKVKVKYVSPEKVLTTLEIYVE